MLYVKTLLLMNKTFLLALFTPLLIFSQALSCLKAHIDDSFKLMPLERAFSHFWYFQQTSLFTYLNPNLTLVKKKQTNAREKSEE